MKCTNADEIRPVFLDTNVLVYMFDADAQGKQAQARQLFGKMAR